MKKSLLSVLLALALVLTSAGVCFATTYSSYTYEPTDFTQVVKGKYFYQVLGSDVTSSGLYLFNDLSIYRIDSSSVYFVYNGVRSDRDYSLSTSSSFSFCMTGSYGILYFSTGNPYFGDSMYGTNDTLPVNGTSLTNTTLGISFGDSVEGSYHSSNTGEVLSFSLQPGYAFVIDGACEVVERSYYINNSWNFTTSENNRVNGSIERNLGSSSIRDGFSPDRLRARSELIQWEALNPNIFGKASNYEYYNSSSVFVNTGEVFLISYPTLYGYGTASSNITYENAVNMTCSVYIIYSTRPTLRYVALESLSEFSSSGNFSTYSVFRPDVADVEGESSSGSGNTIITPEENLPSGGGNNGQPAVNDDNSLLGVISKLVNDIKVLFSNAVEGISELVNTGSSFMQSIGAMFSWLPSPVLGVIISAFTILLVVGVLKVLWR